MTEPRVSAEAFAAAVDRFCGPRSHRAPRIVVKLGGSAMEGPASTDSCLRCVATLNKIHLTVVLVHGGGKPIDRAMSPAVCSAHLISHAIDTLANPEISIAPGSRPAAAAY